MLPRGPGLWLPEDTLWTDDNTDGLDVCEFMELTIRLTKGSRRGEHVRLRHWQGDLICDALRLRADLRRLYRNYEVFIARKNSKSLLGSGFALQGLFDEMGAEVYSAGGDKDQAKIVFKEVVEAVEMSPELDSKQGGLLKVYRDAIEYPAGGSIYRALSAEAYTKEGLNPSRVIFDEKHVQPNDELWNVLNEGSGTREQPLVLTLTTKGAVYQADGGETICYKGYQEAKKVQSGQVDNPYYGCRIYETDPKLTDYRDQANWWQANPALGDFLTLEDMDSRAKLMSEADFKAKRLNIWVVSATPWLPDGKWDECAAPRALSTADRVVLGFDGSFSNDTTALVAWTVATEPYGDVVALWERPPDAATDWRVPILDVEAAIRAACKRFTVTEIVCDPYRWARTMQLLADEGLPMVEFPQSPQRMTPATQRFFEAVVNGTLTHSGDPRLAGHVGNCVLKTDSRGSRIAKESKQSNRKIDLAVASVMAFDGAATPPETVPTVRVINLNDL